MSSPSESGFPPAGEPEQPLEPNVDPSSEQPETPPTRAMTLGEAMNIAGHTRSVRIGSRAHRDAEALAVLAGEVRRLQRVHVPPAAAPADAKDPAPDAEDAEDARLSALLDQVSTLLNEADVLGVVFVASREAGATRLHITDGSWCRLRAMDKASYALDLGRDEDPADVAATFDAIAGMSRELTKAAQQFHQLTGEIANGLTQILACLERDEQAPGEAPEREGFTRFSVRVAGVGNPFPQLGEVVITAGIRRACAEAQIARYLHRHAIGDWGIRGTPAEPDAFADDHAMNAHNRARGYGRVHSAYELDPDKPAPGDGTNTVWVITDLPPEGQPRTTVLLPEEY